MCVMRWSRSQDSAMGVELDIFEKRILLETSEPHYKLDVSPPPPPLIPPLPSSPPPQSFSLTPLFSSLPFPQSNFLTSSTPSSPFPSPPPPHPPTLPAFPHISVHKVSSMTPHRSWPCPTQLKRRKPERSSTRQRKLS